MRKNFHLLDSQMRRGIIPHEGYIDDTTVNQLASFDFVFLCVDKPAVRKLVSNFLHTHEIPFIDVGMELELIEDQQCLIRTCRVTLSTPISPIIFIAMYLPRKMALMTCTGATFRSLI